MTAAEITRRLRRVADLRRLCRALHETNHKAIEKIQRMKGQLAERSLT